MRFAIFHVPTSAGADDDRQVIESIVDQSLLADELGFSTVFLPEHHLTGYSPPGSNPFMLAAHLAPQLKRAYVGFAIVVVPLHHPVRLAESINMIDHLAKGRVVIGVGSGFNATELIGLGTRAGPALAEETEDVLSLALELLERTGDEDEPLRIDLPLYKGVVSERIVPGPYSPGGPIMMGVGQRDRSIKRAAEKGWPVFFLGSGGPTDEHEKLVQRTRYYREQLAAAGHPPEVTARAMDWTTNHAILCAIADTDEQAYAEAQVALEGHMQVHHRQAEMMARALRSAGLDPPDGPRFPPATSREFMDNACVIGSVETVKRRLERLAEIGMGQLNMSFNLGLPQDRRRHELTERWMRLFAEEVIPHFADRKPPADPLAIDLAPLTGPIDDIVARHVV